jgi:hypothetical protein
VRRALGRVGLAVALLAAAGGTARAHTGGSTGYASIVISRGTVRYSVTLPAAALPPPLADALRLAQAGSGRSEARLHEPWRHDLRVLSCPGSTRPGPARVREHPARARESHIPHAYHWGQALPLTGEWVKKAFGPKRDAWLAARRRFLSSRGRAMFANALPASGGPRGVSFGGKAPEVLPRGHRLGNRARRNGAAVLSSKV